MMKRMLSVLLCLIMIPAMALGAARMPDMRGAVTDAADVLSQQTAEDLAAYAERLEDATDLRLHTAIVHFLDGMDAQAYANALFAKWELEEESILLLGAAGEDTFAMVMGGKAEKTLGKANAENLLFTSSEFSTLFRTQQYDSAYASYCTALNALAAKQTGESIRMDGLFGQSTPTPAQQVQNYTSELWSDVMEAISDSSESYHHLHERGEREEEGLTAGGWIVLIILVIIMLRRNKADRKRKPGCLGWLFGLFGINLLMDFLRGRRR